MLILALDTTNEKGGVVVYRDLDCLGAVANEGPANIYSVTLFQMVERLLSQVRITLPEVELYAVANGPGSFTGIRVGVAAAQAWGRAFGRPVRGVSVLEAMVEGARPETDWAVPILDARRGEFFLARFRRCGPPSGALYRLAQGGARRAQEGPPPVGFGAQSGPPVVASEPACAGGPQGGQQTDSVVSAFEPDGEGCVLKPKALMAFFAEHIPTGAAVTCLVREHDSAARALQPVLPQGYRWERIPGTLVGAIARLGLEAQRRGIRETPAGLDAYYIRRPDAELNWHE
jgi:tRNA threonylcarbamoyl adenosine modification protein YeaZ